MTPLEYAERLVSQYADDFTIQKSLLKGRSHLPRVAVDWSNPFFKLLPTQKVAVNEEGIRTARFTCAKVYQFYLTHLLAAGIDPLAETAAAPIVNQQAWDAARAIVRLTGALPEPDYVERMSALVADAIERSADAQLASALQSESL